MPTSTINGTRHQLDELGDGNSGTYCNSRFRIIVLHKQVRDIANVNV